MRGSASLLVAISCGLLSACELQEVSVVDVEDVIVAEVYVNLAGDPAGNRVLGVLHRTLHGTDQPDGELADAVLRLTRADGLEVELVGAVDDECLTSVRVGAPVACYVAGPADAALLRAGDRLDLRVDLPGGAALFGATTVPGAFELEGIDGACQMDPSTLVPLEWSRSEGAWAYINEASIIGLPDALRAEGIELTEPLDEPFYLLGLSISADDTSIVLPSEFGLFSRFDLQQEVAVRLQGGLPEGAHGEVSIRAVDRNYVNWVRGGNFNPSGTVRVPSLVGDGTGVFAATVGRGFDFFVDPDAPFAACPRS